MSIQTENQTLLRVYDSGFKNLPWSLPQEQENFLRIDLERVLEKPKAKQILQAMPPQLIYLAIKSSKMENLDLAAVLSNLSNDQMVRILDYDVWPEDELKPLSVLQWLSPLKDLEPSALARRFRGLDEEYQLATLEGVIKSYDAETVEKMPDAERDSLFAAPGGELFYQIETDDAEFSENVQNLIQSAFSLDPRYALNLLAHAAFIPPNESELHLSQFRKARLEEDGFVTREEGLSSFVPIVLDEKFSEKRSEDLVGKSLAVHEDKKGSSFLEEVILCAIDSGKWSAEDGIQFQQGCLFLANSLCAAVGISPAEVRELNQILEQEKALVSLGLESLHPESLDHALDELRQQYAKQLFRRGLGVVDQLRSKWCDKLKDLMGDQNPKYQRFERLYRLNRWGEIQFHLETQFSDFLSLQTIELLKGLFNRFPMFAEKKISDDGNEIFEFEPFFRLNQIQKFDLTLEKAFRQEFNVIQ